MPSTRLLQPLLTPSEINIVDLGPRRAPDGHAVHSIVLELENLRRALPLLVPLLDRLRVLLIHGPLDHRRPNSDTVPVNIAWLSSIGGSTRFRQSAKIVNTVMSSSLRFRAAVIVNPDEFGV